MHDMIYIYIYMCTHYIYMFIYYIYIHTYTIHGNWVSWKLGQITQGLGSELLPSGLKGALVVPCRAKNLACL
jgi:hypothetical protein